jgi:drug/metabolite transporter (DMT)-like permease
MGTATQLITAGLCMTTISIAAGERCPESVSLRSLGGLAYLTVFCSLIAFSAYGFLLRNASPAIATSHAYVNPIIAIALGARFGGESLSRPLLAAGALLLAGIVTITVAQLRDRRVARGDDAVNEALAGERLSIERLSIAH